MELLKNFFDNERTCCVGLCALRRKVFIQDQMERYINQQMSIYNRNIFINRQHAM